MRSISWRTRLKGPRAVRGLCSYCGAAWESSDLHRDEGGNYVCPLHGNGRDRTALDRTNADLAASIREELESGYKGPTSDENDLPDEVHHTTRDEVLS